MTKTDRALHLIRVTRKDDILEHASGKLYRVQYREGVNTLGTISYGNGQVDGYPLPLNRCRVTVVGQRNGSDFGPTRTLDLDGLVRNVSADERGEWV